MDAGWYDVVIVGAGPAGGTAAHFLGEAGLRVLVETKTGKTFNGRLDSRDGG